MAQQPEVPGKLSIPQVVTYLNRIDQYLLAVVKEMREVQQEVSTFWGLFGDGEADNLAMANLDSMVREISKFTERFSTNHQKLVTDLSGLQGDLDRDNLDRATIDLVTMKTNRLLEDYVEYESAIAEMKKKFMDSASYFLFPASQPD